MLAGSSAPVAVASSWIFVDEIIVLADAQSLTFGSGGDGELGAALDGDVDETYLIESYYQPPTTSTYHLEWRPNGSATGTLGESTWIYTTGAAKNGGENADLLIARTFTTSAIVLAETLIYAKSGQERYAITTEINFASTALAAMREYASDWNNTVDNITSIELLSAGAAGIKIGSHFRLFKKVTP